MHATTQRLYAAAKSMKDVEGQSNLAKLLGESPQTIKNWEARGVSKNGMLKAQQIIGCNAVWIETGGGPEYSLTSGLLAGYEQSKANTVMAGMVYRVPLVSWVRAGDWADVTDNLAGDGNMVETTYKAKPNTFALIVEGQSMEPKFPAGCTIIVEPDAIPSNGSYIIVRQNGDTEATFKQLVVEGNHKYLKALNPDWPRRIIEMLPDAVICGVVKKIEMEV